MLALKALLVFAVALGSFILVLYRLGFLRALLLLVLVLSLCSMKDHSASCAERLRE